MEDLTATKPKKPYLALIPGGSALEQEAYYISKAMASYNVKPAQYIISTEPPKVNDEKIYCKVVDAQDVAHAVHRLTRGDGSYIYFHIGRQP